jgi:hypothetical protein
MKIGRNNLLPPNSITSPDGSRRLALVGTLGPACSVGPFSIGKTQEEESGREGFEPRRCEESAGRFGPFSRSPKDTPHDRISCRRRQRRAALDACHRSRRFRDC